MLKKFDFTMLPFLLIVSIFLLSSHWFLYFCGVNFFAITHTKTKLILFFVLFFLSISFIISATLVRWQENFFTKSFYTVAGVWLGTAINLLVAGLVVWIIILLVSPFLKINSSLIATIAIILTVINVVYSVWNAFHPVVNQVEVKIDNLPVQWQGKKIIQLSDIHLGVVHQADYFKKIVDQVNALDPDFIFITGDLFDGMDGALQTFVEPLNNLQAKQGIYYVTGNHEFYLGIEEALKILHQTKIKILNNEIVEVDGLQIIGISYPGFGNSPDVASVIKAQPNFDLNKPKILLYHTPTSLGPDKNGQAVSRNNTYWQPDVNTSSAKELKIDLQLSGHTHHGQFFPFNLVTNWLYHGRDYGLYQDGNFHLYVSSGAGTWGPPLRNVVKPEIVLFDLK